MAEPPLEAGAAQLSDTWALPGVAARPVGAPGAVAAPVWTTTSSTAHPGWLRGKVSMLSKLNRIWLPVDLKADRSRVTGAKVVWAGFVLSRVHNVVQAPVAVLACTVIWSVWPL